jgi:N,N'-diacetyllegionaminate synthase
LKTLIIAEAGVNHNGDEKMAQQLVAVATQAGADVVKFQTFKADRLVTIGADKAAYQQATTARTESQHEMLRKLELSEAMHDRLMHECRTLGIEFLSTAFDLESVDYLCQLGLRRMKIPSGEITNLPYLRKLGACGLPVILSTGMASMAEIEAAINVLEQSGTSRSELVVLHCSTEYPAPKEEVNLRAMHSIRDAFGVKVGYSDHTEGIEIAIAAVALGACVIEKHFTLDRRLRGPDHCASIEPNELALMVSSIRHIEMALGDGIKRPSTSEMRNLDVARKSLIAACPIRAGETFTEQNITIKRPGYGISPMRWDEIIGRRAPRDFATDEMIET